MKIREITLYTALVAGSVFAGNRIEHYQASRQMETERQKTQRSFSEIQDRLSTCQTGMRRYETRNGGKTWKLNPDLSVDITGINGTTTVELRPEYHAIFRNQKR